VGWDGRYGGIGERVLVDVVFCLVRKMVGMCSLLFLFLFLFTNSSPMHSLLSPCSSLVIPLFLDDFFSSCLLHPFFPPSASASASVASTPSATSPFAGIFVSTNQGAKKLGISFHRHEFLSPFEDDAPAITFPPSPSQALR
jgi:hypothetical protein